MKNSWQNMAHFMNLPKHTSDNCENGKCQIQEALALLQKLSLFRDTPLDILKLYAYLSKKHEFKKGTLIIQQGKLCQQMYLIIKGQVSIYEEYNGINYKLQQLEDDGLNYFGELSLLTSIDSFFSAWAETDVILLSITREAFQKVMERYPDMYSKAIEKIITLRIARSTDQTRRLIEKTSPHVWHDSDSKLKK